MLSKTESNYNITAILSNKFLKENHLNATIEEYRYIANRLNVYDNVEVFFFPDREDIILDLNHYLSP